MNNRWHAAVVLVAFLDLGFAAEEPGGRDLKLLQGTWQIESYTVNGKECPKELVSKAMVTIAGDKWTEKAFPVFQDGKFRLGNDGTVPIQLNESKKPKWFDFVHVDTEGKKSATQGIYELNGDELKICYRGGVPKDSSEPNRPPQFTSKAESGVYLNVLKRVKK
jgi:uncharacterized protein (TIGR03067 family)